MLNSTGFPRTVETKAGSCVVVKTKNTDQVTKVLQQTPQCSGGVAHSPLPQRSSSQDELVIHHVHIQTTSQLSEEAAPHIYSPVRLQSHTHALGVTPALQHVSVPEQHSVDSANDPHPEGKENYCVSQNHSQSVARRGVLPNSSLNATVPPRRPVLSSREIHSRAQSMARSRLEKAKRHLQGRIQQSISLFGSAEISVAQVKRKRVVFCFYTF